MREMYELHRKIHIIILIHTRIKPLKMQNCAYTKVLNIYHFLPRYMPAYATVLQMYTTYA